MFYTGRVRAKPWIQGLAELFLSKLETRDSHIEHRDSRKLFKCGSYKFFEQRMRPVGTRFKFWMELGGHKPWMIRNFNDFYQTTIQRGSRKLQSCLLELSAVLVINFIAMTMALIDNFVLICFIREAILHQLRRGNT